jgi:hypothetical protein
MDRLALADERAVESSEDEAAEPGSATVPFVGPFEGKVVKGSDGRAYLDFFAGIAVNALGHSDAGVARVLTAQASRVQHLSNLYHSWEPLRLAEQLVRRSANFKKVFLCNSGTEANEGALKFAKKHALAAALRGAAGLPAGARPPPFTAFGCKASPPTACFTQGGVCGCWPQATNHTVAPRNTKHQCVLLCLYCEIVLCSSFGILIVGEN